MTLLLAIVGSFAIVFMIFAVISVFICAWRTPKGPKP
jgi:hypothetical protein